MARTNPVPKKPKGLKVFGGSVPKYDWDYYRQRYVVGDMSLIDLAALPGAPAHRTLTNRSSRENWTDQRNAYKEQIGRRTRDLVSTSEAEVQARHVRIAKALQHKGLEALSKLKVEDLKPRELLAFLRDATEIERKALGLETVRILDMSKKPSEMSDDELQVALDTFNQRQLTQGN